MATNKKIVELLDAARPVKITATGEIVEEGETAPDASGEQRAVATGQPVTQLKPIRWYCRA